MNLIRLFVVAFMAFSFSVASLSAAAEEQKTKVETPAAVQVQQVNINTADAQTIANALSGVGLKKAEAIVEYRTAHGKFKTAEELEAVKGIGAATIEKNKAVLLFQ